jgi:hypothetical protein
VEFAAFNSNHIAKIQMVPRFVEISSPAGVLFYNLLQQRRFFFDN